MEVTENIKCGNAVVGPLGIVSIDGIIDDDTILKVRELVDMGRVASMFILGDLLIAAKPSFKEKYTKYKASTGNNIPFDSYVVSLMSSLYGVPFEKVALAERMARVVSGKYMRLRSTEGITVGMWQSVVGTIELAVKANGKAPKIDDVYAFLMAAKVRTDKEDAPGDVTAPFFKALEKADSTLASFDKAGVEAMDPQELEQVLNAMKGIRRLFAAMVAVRSRMRSKGSTKK